MNKTEEKQLSNDMQTLISRSYSRLKFNEKVMECILLDVMNDLLDLDDHSNPRKVYRDRQREDLKEAIKSIRAELDEYGKQIEFVDNLCKKYPELKV